MIRQTENLWGWFKDKVSSFGTTGWFAVGLAGGVAVLFSAMCMSDFGLWKRLFFFSIDPADSFMDFFNPIYWSASLPTAYQNPLSIYPPLITLLAGLTSQLFPAAVFGLHWRGFPLRALWSGQLLLGIYLISTVGLFAYQLFLAKTGDKKERILFCICVLFSFPFLYWMERGNVILWAVMGSLFFVLNYDSPQKYVRHIALFMLALAVCIKIYPAILGILLLKEKKYNEIMLLGIYVLIGFIVPMFWLGGIDKILFMFQNVQNYLPQGISYQGFSAQAIVNACILLVIPGPTALALATLTGGVPYILLGTGVVAGYVLQAKWKVVALSCLLMILVPAISWTYVLLLMIIPLVLFLNSYQPSVVNRIYLLLFIVIFAFKIPFQLSCAFGVVQGADWVTGLALLLMFTMLCTEGLMLLRKQWIAQKKN